MSTSTFWQKQLLCPVCSTKVIVQKVRQGSYEVEKRDADFCVWYKGVNPVFYSIHVCPSCNYASTAEDFDKLDRRTAQRLQSEVQTDAGSDEFSGLMSAELAIKAHIMAIETFRKIPGSEGKIAGLCLRIAWLFRQKGEPDEEANYLQQSIDNYKIAFESATKLPEKLGEIGVAYLIGEISRRLGQTKEAIRWFNVALSNKGIKMRPDLEKLARGQWQATREGYQEENKIASMGVPFGKLAFNPDQLKEITNLIQKYSANDYDSVKEFERVFSSNAGIKFSIAFNHRYFAFKSLIECLGLSDGDEVVVPAFAPPNLSSALADAGIVIKAADTNGQNLSISAKDIANCISLRTKAIFVEHFAGNKLDFKELKDTVNNSQIPLIRLAYESLGEKSLPNSNGSNWHSTIFDLASLSTITALTGAVIGTQDQAVAEKLRSYMNHPAEVGYTYHGLAAPADSPGFDYQLNAFNAGIAILTAKDFENNLQKNLKIYQAYKLAFDKLTKEGKAKILSGDSVYGSFALKLNDSVTADNIVAKAKEVHVILQKLPVPVSKLLATQTSCPNAEEIYGKVVLLPVFPSMTHMDVERIGSLVISAIGQ